MFETVISANADEKGKNYSIRFGIAVILPLKV
jgi:hypothetical protein